MSSIAVVWLASEVLLPTCSKVLVGGGDWPQRWANADHEGRCDMARSFAAEELAKLASASQRKTSLTETERGE